MPRMRTRRVWISITNERYRRLRNTVSTCKKSHDRIPHAWEARNCRQGDYHVFTLTSPDRLVIDVRHVALGKFPGIWDITSWPQYWATQYSLLNGHQPWLSSPSSVVQVWAGGYGSASVVRQVSANTFKVTKPDGKTFTVTGVRPVSVPGPWVITKIA